MGIWKAIALDSVRHELIAEELGLMGYEWDKCAHVPATGSLAKAIRGTKSAAMPIATLIDLIVMDGLPSSLSVKIDDFPDYKAFKNDVDGSYMNEVRDWQNLIAGRRIWMTIEYQQHLRDYLKRRGHSRNLQRVITRSLRDYIKTTQTLIASGIRPEFLQPTEQVAKVATDAWIDLELNYPAVRAIRDDLWMDLDEFEAGISDRAKSLRARIYQALEQIFGVADGVRTIVYHGYYFFTSAQWAFFQLVRRLHDVNQIFIVHDDGKSPIYETWRWYFVSTWGMPQPEIRPLRNVRSAGLTALHNALKGEKVDTGSLVGKLEVVECRTPTQFVRHWTIDQSNEKSAGRNKPKTFAASASDISRYLDRFAGVSQLGKVNLSLLPLGAFLYGLHDCIKLDRNGNVRIELSAETLTDIASSGYLPINPLPNVEYQNISPLSRALPFFADCRIGSEWVERAQTLHRLIITEVDVLGAKTSTDNDVQRMTTSAGNPIRLAPWADLSQDEARFILDVIVNTVAIASEIAANERISLKKHINFVKTLLVRGMRNLPVEVKKEIEGKIAGMSVSIDAEVSAEGLKEVVTLLLGQSADFTLSGSDVESDMEANELRGLDALGLIPTDSALHIANLADGTFPSKVSTVGWPYRMSDIEVPGAAIDQSAIEILRTRSKTASLSDLYLLSLGLNGVKESNKITLSYIAEVGSEVNNPSPILTLLTVPGHRPTNAIMERAGGLTISKVDMGLDSAALRTRRNPSSVVAAQDALVASAALVHPTAAASAIACPRRFAIQWATGKSAAYMSDHHHLILFGNLLGSLPAFGMVTARARRACTDLWRQFTGGQRSSSEQKSVAKPGGAHWAWLFTLSGTRARQDPVAGAYRAAIGGQHQPHEVLAPRTSTFLPIVNDTEQFDICNECPVKPRCAVWFSPTK
jgi:hypothetical protein